MASTNVVNHARSNPWVAMKALALLFIAGLMATVAFFEVASQLPGGRPAPFDFPLLLTPNVLNISTDEKEKILLREIDPDEKRRLTELGRKRLAAEPLDPTALLLSSVGQDNEAGARTLLIAGAISRRDRLVQLELIRMNASKREVDASIRNLDYLLTVTPRVAPEILNKFVVGFDRADLVDLFRRYGDRPWYSELVRQALISLPSGETAAELLVQPNVNAKKIDIQTAAALVNKLVGEDQLVLVRTVIKAVHGIDIDVDGNFGPNGANVDELAFPISWTLTSDGNVETQFNGRRIAITARRGLGAVALTRVTGYPAGAYELKQSISGKGDGVQFTWRLSCSKGGQFQEIWSHPLAIYSNMSRDTARVVIPKDCLTQKWILFADNNLGVEDALLYINLIRLDRV
jgi:hypothetical protein